MKIKSASNIAIVAAIAAILYLFAGHSFVLFHFGGKAELIATASEIQDHCRRAGRCPGQLPDWMPAGEGRLEKESMLYIVEGAEAREFRLIYRFALPDDWFEASGGSDRYLKIGWRHR